VKERGVDGGVGAGGKRSRDAYEGGAGASSPPLDEPEVILLDGPDGKVPMLVLNDADDLAGDGEGEGEGVGVPGGVGVGVGRSAAPPPLVVGVGGVPRRLRPVCDQALPWSASFIGCPGIRCRGAGAASLGVDLTPLFAADGTRLGGARSKGGARGVEPDGPGGVRREGRGGVPLVAAKRAADVRRGEGSGGAARGDGAVGAGEAAQGEAGGRAVRGVLPGARRAVGGGEEDIRRRRRARGRRRRGSGGRVKEGRGGRGQTSVVSHFVPLFGPKT
jgi:hypothetical protein